MASRTDAAARDDRDGTGVPGPLDPEEWIPDAHGVPSRRAARVVALARSPRPAVLLVVGHDFADAERSWAFTPGGGILPGESPADAAVRELAEETGLRVSVDDLRGPVLRRSARLDFRTVTCRQDEEFFATEIDRDATGEGAGGLDRSGWTEAERQVLDSVRWWPLDELDAAVGEGLVVYPGLLPTLVRDLLAGWDGRTLEVHEAD